MLIDIHAHLNMPEYADLAGVLERADQAGVKRIIDVSFDLESMRRSFSLSKEYEHIYSSLGIHPHDAESFTDDLLKEIREKAVSSKVVAIGEIGLDYYRNLSPQDAQKEVFRKQLRLAQEMDLPMMIHSRDAYRDTFILVREEIKGNVSGVMHCYGGGLEFLGEFLSMGFYFSFGGPVTFKNADELRKTVKEVPLDRIMLETDCPYLAPQVYRGQRNEPSYLKIIAEAIAKVKNVSYQELAYTTTKNAETLFTRIT
ncbi:MAG: TatD family hydrolase [Candidatus Saganbacteria bacterium]|nr:TatD family hydrolase [Candidatus Saganbacteria bacterium]